MEMVEINGKKVYAKRNGKYLKLYDDLLDYILDIPSPHLADMYCREYGTETVSDILLRKLCE